MEDFGQRLVKRLILFTLLALAGCGKPVPEAADGYRFDPKAIEWDRPDMKISVVDHPSLADLINALPAADRARMLDQGGKVLEAGWAVPNLRAGTCIIHVVDPKVHYAPEWEGHERAHCRYGRWHK